MASYVKFLRGTQTAYDKLVANNTIDQDTLYFVYESAGSSKGKLYLGNKAIATGEGGTTTPVDIEDLNNVAISAGLADKDFLAYDAATSKWVNKPLATIVAEVQAEIAVMSGATAEADGSKGLVPQPVKGDQDKFLSGDGTWVAIPAKDLTVDDVAKIPELITTVGTINGDENTEGSFRNVIKTEVTNLIGGAGEAFDTLKEIQDWITTDGDATNKLITRVVNLETEQTKMTSRIDDLDARLQWVDMTE